MNATPLCWLAILISGVGVGTLGLFLRMLWDRLIVMEGRHAECERKLNEVETKLLMFEAAHAS